MAGGLTSTASQDNRPVTPAAHEPWAGGLGGGSQTTVQPLWQMQGVGPCCLEQLGMGEVRGVCRSHGTAGACGRARSRSYRRMPSRDCACPVT